MLTLTDKEKMLSSYLTAGRTSVSSEDFEEFEILESWLGQEGRMRGEAVLKIWLAYTLSQKGQLDSAAERARNFLELVRQGSVPELPPNVEWFLNVVGQHFVPTHPGLAKEIIRYALELAKAREDKRLVGILSISLAFAYKHDAQPKQAARLFEIASTLVDDEVRRVNCLSNAAYLYRSDQLERCLRLLEQAVGDQNGRTSDRSLLAALNHVRRRFILEYSGEANQELVFKVIEDLTQSLLDLGENQPLAEVYYESGVVLERLGYSDAARQYFSESSRLAGEVEDWRLYANASLQLVLYILQDRDVEGAVEALGDLEHVARFLNDLQLLARVEKLYRTLEKVRQTESVQPANVPEETANQVFQPQEFVENTLGDEGTQWTDPSSQSVNTTYPPRTTGTSPPTQVPDPSPTEAEPNVTDTPVPDSRSSTTTLPQGERTALKEGPVTRERLRRLIGEHLRSLGYDVELRYRPAMAEIVVDVVATKGKIRKQRLFIIIAEDEMDARLSLNLLTSLREQGRKVLFLQSGDPRNVVVGQDYSVVDDVADLEAS